MKKLLVAVVLLTAGCSMVAETKREMRKEFIEKLRATEIELEKLKKEAMREKLERRKKKLNKEQVALIEERKGKGKSRGELYRTKFLLARYCSADNRVRDRHYWDNKYAKSQEQLNVEHERELEKIPSLFERWKARWTTSPIQQEYTNTDCQKFVDRYTSAYFDLKKQIDMIDNEIKSINRKIRELGPSK